MANRKGPEECFGTQGVGTVGNLPSIDHYLLDLASYVLNGDNLHAVLFDRRPMKYWC
jgi:hypothetical protein